MFRNWPALIIGLAACGSPNVASSPTVTASSIRWSETTAPKDVVVSGAQWLKIEGAGGNSKNVQVAAVLRPQGSGAFPLVVWLHGGAYHVGSPAVSRHLAGLLSAAAETTFTYSR